MADICATCRFWLPDPETGDYDDHPVAFGQCRRNPPVISDHMATMTIGLVGFGGRTFDAEQIATTNAIHDATLRPVTFCTDWCGEFSAIPSLEPVRV